MVSRVYEITYSIFGSNVHHFEDTVCWPNITELRV